MLSLRVAVLAVTWGSCKPFSTSSLREREKLERSPRGARMVRIGPSTRSCVWNCGAPALRLMITRAMDVGPAFLATRSLWLICG